MIRRTPSIISLGCIGIDDGIHGKYQWTDVAKEIGRVVRVCHICILLLVVVVVSVTRRKARGRGYHRINPEILSLHVVRSCVFGVGPTSPHEDPG